MNEVDLVAVAKRAEESVNFIEALFGHIGVNINGYGAVATELVISTKVIREIIDKSFLDVSVDHGDKVSREYFERNLDANYALVHFFSSNYTNSINSSPLEVEFDETDGKEPNLLNIFIDHIVDCFNNAARPANVTLH